MDNSEPILIDEGVGTALEDNQVLVQMLPESGLLAINVICRLCANPNERVIGIFSEEGISNDLANKMNMYLPIKVCETDSLPLQCCWNCASTVLAWHELVVASVEADRRLRDLPNVDEKQIINEDDCSCINDDTQSPDGTIILENKSGGNGTLDGGGVKNENFYECKIEEEYIYCTVCNIKFSSETLSTNHNCTLNESSKLAKGETFICDICNAEFKTHLDILNHIRNHPKLNSHKSIFCKECNEAFEDNFELEKHQTTQHVSLNAYGEKEAKGINIKCDICKNEFKKKSDLNEHLRKDHGQKLFRFRRQKSDIIAQYFCDICNRGFTRKYDMEKHRKNKHPHEPKLEMELTKQQKSIQFYKNCRIRGDDNIYYYKCEVCNKLFRQTYNLVRHQTIHTGVRAFFCHLCGKNFRVSGGLHRHIKEHHLGVKKYKCDICSKSFAAKATRDDHRNIHTNNRPFVCDVCGKAFKQKATLHIHKLFHGDNYRFTCNVCGKKFRRACELKVHSWLHTGHKPYQCTLCEARFRLGQDLKRHLKIHDKLNECVCNECGSTFRQERYLKNHKKTHLIKARKLFDTHPLSTL